MIYSNELFTRAKEIIAERRAAAEAASAARMREFELKEPRYRLCRQEMIDSVRDALTAIEMDREGAKEFLTVQRERNLAAQKEVKALLRAHGLPENYLETGYTCPICGDTGSVGIELCSCFRSLLEKLAFEEAGKKSPLRFSTFADFRLDYYSDEVLPEYRCSPRARMEEILSLCKAYAADFDTDSPNLLFCGETGLGKTHLSLAIAGEVIKKGYTVLYNSAQNVFNELQKEYFGKAENRGKYETLVLECDLLVLDDLGAEFSTPFTDAALYNIINTRINTRRPTIISTNLKLNEIEARYEKRISSRLIGEFLFLRCLGADIRQAKTD